MSDLTYLTMAQYNDISYDYMRTYTFRLSVHFCLKGKARKKKICEKKKRRSFPSSHVWFSANAEQRAGRLATSRK